MREILFRGKAVNRIEGFNYRTNYKNGDWVYGLITDMKNFYDYAQMTNTDGVSGIDVDEETIGQFTGLYDKNGKKIFEGDIVEVDEVIYVVGFGHHISPCSDYPYDCGNAYGFYLENEEKFSINEDDILDIKIIGNKFDNPELLECV